ncbi:MAG: amidohydrolase [Betaproteobacteria bacterium]|nr:amidohydrolase [Betaproteobacteria bacterium]MDH3437110.1 amidohydrolase [Betaproteobacteria bacterium]
MLIADAQVHIWAASTPERPWPARHRPHRPEPLGKEELLKEMDAAGVSCAVIVPPSWEGERNDLALAAAQADPDRFAVMGRLDPEGSEARAAIPGWRKQPGMLGLRFTFHRPGLRELLTEGRVDWLWPAAEKAGVPIMMLVPHELAHLVADIAGRYPGLRIVMDHLGLHASKDEEAFAEFDKFLALAKYPNIAAKASCLPSFTADSYPYRRLHPYIRKVYDAFGPKRMFWGTDLSRLPCTYHQGITLFTEELSWLTPEDKEWIMGRGVCEWLGWKIQ